MSRRAAIAGLAVSVAILLLTVVAVTGAGPSLPGPPVREWLGVGGPADPERCTPSPKSVYDPPGQPGAGRWRAEPHAPVVSPEASAVALGGYIYMVGGQARQGAEGLVLRFDPRSGEYRREPEAPVTIDHPLLAVHGDELILATGYIDGAEPTNRVFAYSTRSRRWRELPPLGTERGAAAGAVVGDELYVAGGTTDYGNENEPVPLLEIYDLRTGKWHRGPPMPTARHHFGVGVVGGKLYFAGGRTPNNQSLNAFERFDPVSGRWQRLAPVPVGTGAPAVTEAGGEVIVTGGGEDPLHPSEPGGWALRASYAYDPQTDRWTRLADMRHARHGHVAAATGGRVYVFRGTLCPGYGETASAESLRLP
jgi:hypothetical protein